MMSTSSEEGSGSKIRLPSVELIIASTLLQLTNLKKRKLTCHGAQFLALVHGASLKHALPSCLFPEDFIAAEAPKRGPSSSRSQPSLEVKSAAATMVTRMHSPVAIVAVKSHASANGVHGVIAAPLAVVEPGHESLKSHKQAHAMARFAPKPMALGSSTTTRKWRNVAWTHAPLMAKENGVSSANAVNHAPTAKATVLLAPRQRPSQSRSRPSTVAKRASGRTV